MNCHECQFAGYIPGTAHICCNHPHVKAVVKDPAANLLAILASVQRTPGFMVAAKALNIKADPFGVARGWCNWPVMFDPTWIRSCDGFKTKEAKI